MPPFLILLVLVYGCDCTQSNTNSTFGLFKVYPQMISLAFPFEILRVEEKLMCLLTCNLLPNCLSLNVFREQSGFHCNFFSKGEAMTKLVASGNADYHEKQVYSDCQDVAFKGNKQSGVYDLAQTSGIKLKTYCDMDTNGGGWTLMQRNGGGTLDFDLPLADYKTGFGDPLSDFWLGLDALHNLTASGEYTMRFDVWCGAVHKYAEYQDFVVGNETDGYRLTFGSYQGDAGNSLGYHFGLKFSAKDADRDEDTNRNCAVLFKGGWWYNSCHGTALNSSPVDPTACDWRGPIWYLACGQCSLSKTELKIKRM